MLITFAKLQNKDDIFNHDVNMSIFCFKSIKRDARLINPGLTVGGVYRVPSWGAAFVFSLVTKLDLGSTTVSEL